MSLGVSINHHTSQSWLWTLQQDIASSEQAGISTGISILDGSWGGIPGDCQASSPYKQGSQLIQGPRNSGTTGQPRGQPHPSNPDLWREQALSKINMIMKVTAAVQEVGSTEPNEHHTNLSQQLPGIILHFRNPMCWCLQTIFSTEIPAYRKHQKMVFFPVWIKHICISKIWPTLLAT